MENSTVGTTCSLNDISFMSNVAWNYTLFDVLILLWSYEIHEVALSVGVEKGTLAGRCLNPMREGFWL